MQEHLSDSHVCPDGAKATVLPRRWQRLSVPGHHPFALTGWKKPQCQSACQPPVSVSCQADCQAGPRGLKSSSQFYFVFCIYFFKLIFIFYSSPARSPCHRLGSGVGGVILLFLFCFVLFKSSYCLYLSNVKYYICYLFCFVIYY